MPHVLDEVDPAAVARTRPARKGSTPLARMRTRTGLLTAYWRSEGWAGAWLAAAGITAFTLLLSWNGIQIAKQSADVLNARAIFQDPSNTSPMRIYAGAVGLWFVMIFAQTAMISLRHLISSNLHRRWRRWMVDRFGSALLGGNRTLLHLTHSREPGRIEDGRSPDNIDQRISDCSKDLIGGVIGLSMGLGGAISALAFAIIELMRISTPVPGLESFGQYGTLVLSVGAALVIVPLATWIAILIGRMISRVTAAMQRHEASYRAHNNAMLRTAFHIAAYGGEGIQRRLAGKLYRDVDSTWIRMNRVDAGFMAFTGLYNPLSANVFAYLPALPAFAARSIGFRDYIAISGIVGGLMSNLDWLITVMPALAQMRTNADRLTEVAVAVEAVQDHRRHYARHGASSFRYTAVPAGLLAHDVALLHRGHDQAPFLRAESIRLLPGDWALVTGPNGAGKSCLMKALAGDGLWAYGSGTIGTSAGARLFYATQDIELEPISLRELVLYNTASGQSAASDEELIALLREVGLSELIGRLDAGGVDGKPWRELLSGGQKQKLIFARMLMARPDIVFLDESTSAMDPVARKAIHAVLRRRLPEAVVVAVQHESETMLDETGEPYFPISLRIRSGIVSQEALTAPAEVDGSALLPALVAKASKRNRRRVDPPSVEPAERLATPPARPERRIAKVAGSLMRRRDDAPVSAATPVSATARRDEPVAALRTPARVLEVRLPARSDQNGFHEDEGPLRHRFGPLPHPGQF